MSGCIVQLLIEILLYETSECVIVNFVIPALVQNEIKIASKELHLAVDKLFDVGRFSDKSIVLNVPNYLYVSTNVAQQFPTIMESVLIRSYQTCWPGQMSDKWKYTPRNIWLDGEDSLGAILRRWSVVALLMHTLQYIGSMPPSLERITIHSIQPLIVCVIVIVWMKLKHNPLWWIAIGVVVIFVIWRHWKNKTKRVIGSVTPVQAIVETQNNNEPSNTKQNEIEKGYNNHNVNDNVIEYEQQEEDQEQEDEDVGEENEYKNEDSSSGSNDDTRMKKMLQVYLNAIEAENELSDWD